MNDLYFVYLAVVVPMGAAALYRLYQLGLIA